jgi:hypothetical protein
MPSAPEWTGSVLLMRTVEVRILPAARRGRSRRAGPPRRPLSLRPRVRIPLLSMAVRYSDVAQLARPVAVNHVIPVRVRASEPDAPEPTWLVEPALYAGRGRVRSPPGARQARVAQQWSAALTKRRSEVRRLPRARKIMVSVVYRLCTPSCGPGGPGSSPGRHPKRVVGGGSPGGL